MNVDVESNHERAIGRDAYARDLTMRQARDQYFAANGFGMDGGYSDAWVDFKVGPVPMPFPNTAGRIRAVKVHDLHHIVTGYRTNFVGELEIAAWEVGSGCRDFYMAWYLNLGGMGAGLLVSPRRIYDAFMRGRRSESLYGRDLEELLDQDVGAVARAARTDQPPHAASARDLAAFALAGSVGVAVAAGALVIGLMVAPIGLLMNLVRPRAKAQAA